jgi:hypothetical protein
MTKPDKNNGQIYAILTGDIVNSSGLSSDRRHYLYETLQALSTLVKQKYPREVPFDLAKYRGDGWQLLVSPPKEAFEISLFMRTYIRYQFDQEKLDTRIAIAIGSIDFAPSDNISEGYGVAFTESGKLLDSLKEYRMGVSLLQNTDQMLNRLAKTLLRTSDTLISAWTPAQCQAVHLALYRLTQREIGKRWKSGPIAQASVAKHLKSANWDLIKEISSLYADLFSSIS